MKRILILIVLIEFIIVPDIYAVKQEFKLEKISYTVRQVSSRKDNVYGLNRPDRLSRPEGWGIVEVQYTSLPQWADDVQIKYYILVGGPSIKKMKMLVKNITYTYVEKGKRHISNIYIPPQVLHRYGDVRRIRVELWYKGILQDSLQWPKKHYRYEWWTRITPTYGALYNRFYTPFEHDTQTREELIKIE